jgi:hypothetical protein
MKSGSITIVSASCTELIRAFIILKTMDCSIVRERENAVLRAIAASMVG